VIRNLAGLARMGCRLDLDDFGTGNASITSIRRFAIERIKIDRSFVTRIDEDPEQQKMVSAILTMAERLGLDTLAEGVETPAERDMLVNMGCGHLQGFGIARPMPLPDTTAWLQAAQARAAGDTVLRLPRRA
jgi:EAL domain-containing protein (putative c-di-GMP-specific phosphodiesterase class I)